MWRCGCEPQQIPPLRLWAATNSAFAAVSHSKFRLWKCCNLATDSETAEFRFWCKLRLWFHCKANRAFIKSQEFGGNCRFLRYKFKFIRAGGASAPPECPLYYAWTVMINGCFRTFGRHNQLQCGQYRKGRKYMIILTKLNGEKFMLNPDLIEIVTENPDTVITTSTGHSYIVEQSMNEILSLIKEYRLSVRRQRLERSI